MRRRAPGTRALRFLAWMALGALLLISPVRAESDCLPGCPPACCNADPCDGTCPTACCLAGAPGPNSVVAEPRGGYSGTGIQSHGPTRKDLMAKAASLRSSRQGFLRNKAGLSPTEINALAEAAYAVGGDLPPTQMDDLSVRACLYEMEAVGEALIASGHYAEGRIVVEKVASVYGQLKALYPDSPLLTLVSDVAWTKLSWLDQVIAGGGEVQP